MTKPTSPALPGRRERNKRQKLDGITAAASELFRDQGFEATTGRQICERAGIGTGTLFLYVRDKRELLFLIFRPFAERAFERLPIGLQTGESMVDGLMTLFGSLFRVYGRDAALARLFVQELLFRGDSTEGMQALSAELGSRVARIVSDAQARGELRSDLSVEKLGRALVAHYVFWIQLWLGTGAVGRRAAERGLREALELQLEGIGA
jgi:AcrR family transcriptional regulator